jgi:AraC-like DNA-binding protein
MEIDVQMIVGAAQDLHFENQLGSLTKQSFLKSLQALAHTALGYQILALIQTTALDGFGRIRLRGKALLGSLVDPAGIASPALTPDPDFLAKMLEKLHSIGVCRQKEMPAVYRLIDDSIRLMRTEQAKESPQAELLAAKLTELLLEISLTEKKAEPIKRTTKTEVILPAIHLVSDAIDAHRRLTVAELADACFLSESHFRKVFTAVIGESPKNYLIRTQTRKAAHLLISTETPIAEISCICGFDDTSTFYRRFLRIYGVSPSQYRAGHKK